MTSFNKLKDAENVIAYQKQILSRTGGRSSDNARLYHYTSIDNLLRIIKSGYIWLCSPKNMNDLLEKTVLQNNGKDDLYFISFSRANQSLAMFKMYASGEDGIMLSITISDAKNLLLQKPFIVEKDTKTDKAVDAELYWTGVCYNELNSDRITSPGKENHNIINPLNALAGSVKLMGWEFEKEVRLCANKLLPANQKLAVVLPKDHLEVVLCPQFNTEKNAGKLAELRENKIKYVESDYDKWIKYRL